MSVNKRDLSVNMTQIDVDFLQKQKFSPKCKLNKNFFNIYWKFYYIHKKINSTKISLKFTNPGTNSFSRLNFLPKENFLY